MIIEQISRECFRVELNESDDAWDYSVQSVHWCHHKLGTRRWLEVINSCKLDSPVIVDGFPLRVGEAMEFPIDQFPVEFNLFIPYED